MYLKIRTSRSIGLRYLPVIESIPTQGQSEELTISLKYDQEKTLSFDHLYFRQPPTTAGLDWEALNAQSHELFKATVPRIML